MRPHVYGGDHPTSYTDPIDPYRVHFTPVGISPGQSQHRVSDPDPGNPYSGIVTANGFLSTTIRFAVSYHESVSDRAGSALLMSDFRWH